MSRVDDLIAAARIVERATGKPPTRAVVGRDFLDAMIDELYGSLYGSTMTLDEWRVYALKCSRDKTLSIRGIIVESYTTGPWFGVEA